MREDHVTISSEGENEMPEAKSQAKYTAYKTAWDRENTKQYKLKLNKNTDADLITWLDSIENKQSYLKDLIKADITKSNSLTLKEYLAVMDNDIAITIHQEGEYDGDYLYVSDIEEDLLNRTVIKVETGLPNKTDLRISIK